MQALEAVELTADQDQEVDPLEVGPVLEELVPVRVLETIRAVSVAEATQLTLTPKSSD